MDTPIDSEARFVAIHEASHAVIAWALGVKVHKIEMAENDIPLKGLDGNDRPSDAGHVFHTAGISHPDEFWAPRTEDEQRACAYYRSVIDNELCISFAGVVANVESSGGCIEEMLTQRGRGDALNIEESISVLRKMGCDDSETHSIRSLALQKTQQLVRHYWWEITGIAMILLRWGIIWGDEFYNYMMLFTKRDMRPAW